MPVSLEFLRGIIGLIGIGCAFMLGRSVALFRKGEQRQSRVYGWVFRTGLCMAGVAFRNRLDVADLAIWALSAIAFALSLWNHSRQKKEEDLTGVMFPDDE